MSSDIGRAIALLLTCPAAVVLPGLVMCVLFALCVLSLPMLLAADPE